MSKMKNISSCKAEKVQNRNNQSWSPPGSKTVSEERTECWHWEEGCISEWTNSLSTKDANCSSPLQWQWRNWVSWLICRTSCGQWWLMDELTWKASRSELRFRGVHRTLSSGVFWICRCRYHCRCRTWICKWPQRRDIGEPCPWMRTMNSVWR